MEYPTYLKGHIKEFAEEAIVVCSSAKNELLEVWYYGDLIEIDGETQLYIVCTDMAPAKIMAKDPASGEEFTLFDEGYYGYNSMFCDEYTDEQRNNRTLNQYPISASRLYLEFGYGIDYDDEKDDYNIDWLGRVKLIDGRKVKWKEAKRDGFDWFSLYYMNDNGEKVQIADFELA